MIKSELLAAIKARPECLYFVAESHGDGPSVICESWYVPKLRDMLRGYALKKTKNNPFGVNRLLDEERNPLYTYYWVYCDDSIPNMSVWKHVFVRGYAQSIGQLQECSIDVNSGCTNLPCVHGYIANTVSFETILDSHAEYESLSRPEYIVAKPEPPVTADGTCDKAPIVAMFMLWFSIVLNVVFQYAIKAGLGDKAARSGGLAICRKAGWCKTTHIRGRVYMHVKSNATPRAKRINDVLSGRFMPRVSAVGCH